MASSIETIRAQDPWFRDSATAIRDSTWTKAPRGQITRYEHPVCGDDPLTRERSLPVTVVAGTEEGPLLLLIAGEHGNEYENIVALQDTLNALDPAALKGRVVGIHCCSVDSYVHCDRRAKADGQNLARCYPGNAKGTLTERVAFTLQNDFLGQPGAHKPDFMVALHTYGPGMLGATLTAFNIYPQEPELTEAERQGSLATGLPLVWGHEFDPGHAATSTMGDDDSGRTALHAAFLAGVPAIYWETIWGRGGEEEYTRGLQRLMVHLGMLQGENAPLEPRAVIETAGHGAGNLASHNQAPVTGLWRPAVQPWDRVSVGDVLGEIRDLYGTPLETIRSSRDGIVIGLPRMQYVEEGTQCGVVV
jgi:predicted deacylase